MKTIEKGTSIEFLEKKSRFIGYIKPVNTVLDAEKFIKKISEKHFDATHNVYAYKVVENNQEYFKFNDNGEPLNTAGKPMAEIINRLDVSNLVIVSTRYFGGVKLGAGGLIRNYAKCAKLAIIEAEIIEYVPKSIVLLDYEYTKSAEMDMFLEKNNIEIIEKTYNERVSLKISISDENLKKLKEIKGIIIIEL